MGKKLIVGPINQGLQTNREAFVIDNDSFPKLRNAYQWRGRIKRKRGTELLGRLTRGLVSQSLGNTDGAGAFSVNILSHLSLETTASLVLGDLSLNVGGGAETFTDNGDGTLTGSGSGTGTINYASGALTLTGTGMSAAVLATFTYYPGLPVMGLRDLIINTNENEGMLAFDTVYAYNFIVNSPYTNYSVSFFKNTSTPTTKSTSTAAVWSGQNYQQFWTINYQGALWATNGMEEAFNSSTIGMQFSAVTNVAAPSGQTVDITVSGSNLVVGDWVFLNEFDDAVTSGLNFQTGYVSAGTAPGVVTITLPQAGLGGAGGATTAGIVQYLTNRSDTTRDCLRWYDGDPTAGSPPTPSTATGWVNFCPPLSQGSFSISDLPKAQYYLVGAKLIQKFKDRLLFIGPVVQTSSSSPSPIYLQDTIIYSQNGTPYYTASFSGDPTATTSYTEYLVPTNQTAQPTAFWSDQIGFGGYLELGIDEQILSVSSNEDVLILGTASRQIRLVYTGNDLTPFNGYVINSEYGTTSSFSAINMDEGVLSLGNRGLVITSQVATQRFDTQIPDAIFQIKQTNNGSQRVTAIRDYINEWIYYTSPPNSSDYVFPTQSLFYNYRDKTWAIFDEAYTTYGTFRKATGLTWAALTFEWQEWTDPWGSGENTLLNPEVIGGTTEGFVMIKSEGTGEATSIAIGNISFAASITGASKAAQCVLTCTSTFIAGQQITISGVGGMTELNGNIYTIVSVTSTTVTIDVNSSGFTTYTTGGTATPSEPFYAPNHCLEAGNYVLISDALGTAGTPLNGNIYSITNPTTNGFSLLGSGVATSGTYLGGGLITRMYVPFIQTKQFPLAWDLNRKTRIGPQQYLFTKTDNGQITLLIYLSMDAQNAFNDFNFPYSSPLVPNPSVNNSLVFSSVLYTCPESTNLGLTAPNVNLQQQVVPFAQAQIWHRMNTSLIGDTVQIGFSLNDDQMRDTTFSNQFVEIELHSMVLDVSPAGLLA